MKQAYLWNQPGVPQKGWIAIDCYDLGEGGPYDQCGMCGKEEIRYVHLLEHLDYPGHLQVGSTCAVKLVNDYDVRCRDQRMRNLAARRRRWTSRKWRKVGNGGLALRVRGWKLVVVPDTLLPGRWRYSVRGEVQPGLFGSATEAQLAMFDAFADLIW